MDDDNQSQVSWAAASESDRMLFTVLSNTERLDTERLPRLVSTSPSGDLPRIEEIPHPNETPPPPPDAPTRDSGLSYDDPFLGSMRQSPGRTDEDPYRASANQSPGRAEEDERRRKEREEEEQRALASRMEAQDLEEQRIRELAAQAAQEEEEALRRARHAAEQDPLRAAEQDPPRATEQDPPRAPGVDAETPRELDRAREQMLEKQSTLYDLNQLESRGVRLSRKWTMDDTLEDMTHELRHHLLVLDERENVGMMKNGLKMALTGIEIVNTRFNLLDLEGWSTQASSELDRQDGNLSRIYRKYWRRSTSNNPESEIMFALFSSMGMYHMKRSMARQMMNRNVRGGGGAARTRRPAPVSDDSSDEEPPSSTPR